MSDTPLRSPSQRLRLALLRKYQEDYSDDGFDSYYEMMMDLIIKKVEATMKSTSPVELTQEQHLKNVEDDIAMLQQYVEKPGQSASDRTREMLKAKGIIK